MPSTLRSAPLRHATSSPTPMLDLFAGVWDALTTDRPRESLDADKAVVMAPPRADEVARIELATGSEPQLVAASNRRELAEAARWADAAFDRARSLGLIRARPAVTYRWSARATGGYARRTSAGQYEIALSRRMVVERPLEEWLDVVRHEVAHVVLWQRREPQGHTEGFWQVYASLGGTARYAPAPVVPLVWHTCGRCGTGFAYTRAIGRRRLYCRSCETLHGHHRSHRLVKVEPSRADS